MKEILLPLSKPVSENELYSIELFRERFRILWENWESLKSLGIKLGGHFKNKTDKEKISGDSCNIDIFRLKGYFVDFRFFFAEKEPTNYFNVASFIGKKCNDKRLRDQLKTNKKDWQDAGILNEWHGYSADEMLNYYFHGEIFHSFPDKKEAVNKMLSVMESELAAHLITLTVYDRMLVIRNLNWVLKPLSINNQVLRLPECGGRLEN